MSQNAIQIEPSRRYFPEDMIYIEQAVPLLGLSKKTIQYMAARRELPLYKIKKCIRFRVSELEEWLKDKRSTRSSSKTAR